MSRKTLLSILFVLGLGFTACGGGREDPVAAEIGTEEGRLTLGVNGPNEAVTPSNGLTALQAISEALFKIYSKSTASLSFYSSLESSVRIDGIYSGHALASGEVIAEGPKISYDFSLIYYDYSDAGYLFFGGKQHYTGNIEMVNMQARMQKVVINDQIRFAGLYAGSADFENFPLPIDSTNTLVSLFDLYLKNGEPKFPGWFGKVTFDSNGQKFSLYPYPSTKKPPGG